MPVEVRAEQQSLFGVQDFQIYYGWPSPQKLDELKSHDLVVIAPHAYSEEQIKYIQSSGTLVIGYISVMQLESWNKPFVSNVQESDYYIQDGKKIYVKQWDTYVMDIRQDHYKQLLTDQVRTDIVSKGMDGVFLDTVDDIDYYLHKRDQEQKEFRTAYTELLMKIKKEDERLLLMQNRGFETFKTASENLIDGVLWESFDYDRLKDSRWGQKWIQYFEEKDKNQAAAVFSTVPNKSSAQYSENFGFVSYLKSGSSYN